MRKKVTLNHPIFTRWPAQYPDRLQLFSAPTPNGVKVGIMLEETSLAYEPHRIDIMADESHDPAFLALNPNGKIPAIYDLDGPSGKPLALFESGAILLYLADKTGQFISSDPNTRYGTIQWVMAAHLGPGGAGLIGVDLKKDRATLEGVAKTMGEEPAPRKWLHGRSRRVHSTLPVAVSRQAVPALPKWT